MEEITVNWPSYGGFHFEMSPRIKQDSLRTISIITIYALLCSILPIIRWDQSQKIYKKTLILTSYVLTLFKWNYYFAEASRSQRLKQLYCRVVQKRQNVIELNWERCLLCYVENNNRSGWYLSVFTRRWQGSATNGNPANDNLFSTPLILN